MKKFLLIICATIIMMPAFANDTLLGNCIKEYPLNHKELYLNALSAINTNKFEVLEMQSRSGLILFQSGRGECVGDARCRTEYIATVYFTKSGSSEIKILPANSNFSTGVEVQRAIFTTLDGMLNAK